MSERSLFTWVHATGVLTADSVVGNYQPEALRPVLFVFYTLETVFNMFCMGYHISGFMTIAYASKKEKNSILLVLLGLNF